MGNKFGLWVIGAIFLAASHVAFADSADGSPYRPQDLFLYGSGLHGFDWKQAAHVAEPKELIKTFLSDATTEELELIFDEQLGQNVDRVNLFLSQAKLTELELMPESLVVRALQITTLPAFAFDTFDSAGMEPSSVRAWKKKLAIAALKKIQTRFGIMVSGDRILGLEERLIAQYSRLRRLGFGMISLAGATYFSAEWIQWSLGLSGVFLVGASLPGLVRDFYYQGRDAQDLGQVARILDYWLSSRTAMTVGLEKALRSCLSNMAPPQWLARVRLPYEEYTQVALSLRRFLLSGLFANPQIRTRLSMVYYDMDTRWGVGESVRKADRAQELQDEAQMKEAELDVGVAFSKTVSVAPSDLLKPIQFLKKDGIRKIILPESWLENNLKLRKDLNESGAGSMEIRLNEMVSLIPYGVWLRSPDLDSESFSFFDLSRSESRKRPVRINPLSGPLELWADPWANSPKLVGVFHAESESRVLTGKDFQNQLRQVWWNEMKSKIPGTIRRFCGWTLVNET